MARGRLYCRESPSSSFKAHILRLAPIATAASSMPHAQAEADVEVALGNVGARTKTEGELVEQPEEVPAEEADLRAQRAVHAVADAGEAARLEVAAGAHLHVARDRLALDAGAQPDRDVLTGGLAALRQERLETDAVVGRPDREQLRGDEQVTPRQPAHLALSLALPRLELDLDFDLLIGRAPGFLAPELGIARHVVLQVSVVGRQRALRPAHPLL